jgi:hypothetical protein
MAVYGRGARFQEFRGSKMELEGPKTNWRGAQNQNGGSRKSECLGKELPVPDGPKSPQIFRACRKKMPGTAKNGETVRKRRKKRPTVKKIALKKTAGIRV